MARRWRPAKFADVVGQEHAVEVLTGSLKSGRLHHAYMFTGTRGVGKTTLARILAKAFNCTGADAPVPEPCCECSTCREIASGSCPDVIELDAASHTQVDSMRELIEGAHHAPASGRFRVYIIDEVHMLSKHAFNAMLKTLEEPPGHAKFILATTDPQMVPATVLSRCLRFSLQRLEPERICEQLARIAAAEAIEHEDGALAAIATAADGSMRDALSIFDEIAGTGSPVGEERVRRSIGALARGQANLLLAAVAAADAAALRAACERMYADAASFDAALAELAGLLHRASLAKLDDGYEDEQAREVAGLFSAGAMQALYEISLHGRQNLQWAPDHRSGFEMLLLRMLVVVRHGAAAGESSRPETAAAAGAPASSGPVPAGPPTDAAQWSRLAASLSGSGAALAGHCVFAGLEGNRLRLRLRKGKEYMRKRAEQNLREQLQRLAAGIELEIGTAEDSEAEDTPAHRASVRQQQEDEDARRRIEGSSEYRQIRENFPDAKIARASRKEKREDGAG